MSFDLDDQDQLISLSKLLVRKPQLDDSAQLIRNLVEHLQTHPHQLLDLIGDAQPVNADANQRPRSKPKSQSKSAYGCNLRKIGNNPVKLRLLREFFLSNPENFLNILSNANFSDRDLQQLLTLLKVPSPRQESPRRSSSLAQLDTQLRQLLVTDALLNARGQVKLLTLVSKFEQLKRRLPSSAQIVALDRQLRNLKQVCLHAPNVSGYVSQGSNPVGLITHQGKINYIQGYQSDEANQVNLRKSAHPPLVMLPVVMNNLVSNKQTLVGQLTDSSRKLAMAVVLDRNQPNSLSGQVLVMINPVPVLPEIPVLGTLGNPAKSPSQKTPTTSTTIPTSITATTTMANASTNSNPKPSGRVLSQFDFLDNSS